MSSISHDPPSVGIEKRRWSARSVVPEMWATIAICAIWLAVLFAAVFGPDFVSNSNDGNGTTIPSGVFVALFAFLATRAVAKYGYGRER